MPEPCVSRGSIVTDMAGVYYASQNGLVRLSYSGDDQRHPEPVDQNDLDGRVQGRGIVAWRHRAQYLAINATGQGFLIDYTEPRMGIIKLNTSSDAVAVWNDVYTGDAYIIADKLVYRWDSIETDALTYRWRSRQFYFPRPRVWARVRSPRRVRSTEPAQRGGHATSSTISTRA